MEWRNFKIVNLEDSYGCFSLTRSQKVNRQSNLDFLPLLFDEHALLSYQYVPENVKENKDSLVAAFDDRYGTTPAD